MSVALHLTPDVWELIAGHCVETHKLRTVCNVARDLCSLQSVCNSSRNCASDLWAPVARMCQKRGPARSGVDPVSIKMLKQYLPAKPSKAEQELELARHLPSDQLTVYIQICNDASIKVYSTHAASTYRLTKKDLDGLKVAEVACNPRNRSAPCRLFQKQVGISIHRLPSALTL